MASYGYNLKQETELYSGAVFADGLQTVVTMAHSFKTGDHVRWNSEAGHVSGKITSCYEG